MSVSDTECIVFDPAILLPIDWRAAAAGGPIRTFNPALLPDGAGWIMAYRVVLSDERRRIAVCRLDAALQVVDGSPLPFSDAVRFQHDALLPTIARQWHADPRLYRWGNRIFLYWNSGWHEPQNHQFLQELNPSSLAPVGAPRELILRRGDRRPLEKNWTFFTTGSGELHAVYSVAPHRILRFSVGGTGDIPFDDEADTDWSLVSYPTCHGGLRGGAPPVWHEGCFWSFCHSVHDGAQGYCYEAAVYCFSGDGAFHPLAEPRHPLLLGGSLRDRRSHPRLNPAVDVVIYPCGAVVKDSRWLISHGINDELCAITRLAHEIVRASVQRRPLPPGASVSGRLVAGLGEAGPGSATPATFGAQRLLGDAAPAARTVILGLRCGRRSEECSP
jgi:hypothetical protein